MFHSLIVLVLLSTTSSVTTLSEKLALQVLSMKREYMHQIPDMCFTFLVMHVFHFSCVYTFVFLLPIFSVCENDELLRYVDNVFSMSRPGIGLNLIYFSVEGLFFFILTLLIEVSSSYLYYIFASLFF